MGKVKFVDVGSGRVVGTLKQVLFLHARMFVLPLEQLSPPTRSPPSSLRACQCQGSVRSVDIHPSANLVAAVGLDRCARGLRAIFSFIVSRALVFAPDALLLLTGRRCDVCIRAICSGYLMSPHHQVSARVRLRHAASHF